MHISPSLVASYRGDAQSCARRHSSLTSRTHLSAVGLLLALAVGCDPKTPPTVTELSPADDATDVPLNVVVVATFDRAMETLTDGDFTLSLDGTDIAGVVLSDGASATFTPDEDLVASSLFTATVTTDARSSAGARLQDAVVWSFTTGNDVDTEAPTVSSVDPVDLAEDVAINTVVAVTFSEAMNPVTITDTSFTVTQADTSVAGVVVYGPGTTATFTPDDDLAGNSAFTATITTAVTDQQGVALSTLFTWTFTTGTTEALGPAPVGLGAAGDYVILAKSAISTVPPSVVTGDIALSPAAASFITGFTLVADATNVFSRSTQVVGKVFAADFAVPTPDTLTTAVGAMENAYGDAAGRTSPDFLELGTGAVGGLTLAPGLYTWTSSITIPTDVTISGGANDVWIFQTTGDLSIAAGQQVHLAGGALAKNIFWQVAGQTTFGAGSHFEGVLLCQTDVALQTGATLNGAILSQTQVALQQASVTGN